MASKARISAQEQLLELLSVENDLVKKSSEVLYDELETRKNISAQQKDQVKTLQIIASTEKDGMALNDKILKLKSRAKQVNDATLKAEIKRLLTAKSMTKEVQSQVEKYMSGINKITGKIKSVPGGGMLLKAIGLDDDSMKGYSKKMGRMIADGGGLKNMFGKSAKSSGMMTKTLTGGSASLGAMAGAAGVLVVSIGLIVGLFTVMFKILKSFSAVTDTLGASFGAMGTDLENNVVGNLRESRFEVAQLGKGIKELVSTTNVLANNFGMGLEEASGIAGKVIDTGMALGISDTEAAKLFGTFMKIGDLTAEQAEVLAESTYQLAQQNNVNPSAVMSDIANSSEMIAKFGAQNLDSITKSAIQAKKMGLNLASVEKIADSLLNFQSSLNAEVEASLMIGKQLNFQKARELALSGDMSGMMDNITEQLGGQVAFGRLDVLQKQSLARSLGVSVAEMEKLATNQSKVKDEGKSFVDMLGEDGLSTLTSMINKIKSLGVVFIEKVGPKIEEIVLQIEGWLNSGGFDKLISGAEGLADIMISIVQNMDTTLAVLGGLAGAAIGFMIGGPIGGLIGAAVGAGLGYYGGSQISSGGGGGSTEMATGADVVGAPVQDFRTSGGSHLIVRPNGQVLRTHPNDTIFGSTSVNDFSSGPAGSMPMNTEAIVNELKALREQTDSLIRETKNANISDMFA
tara:strand:- start:40 stop:2100 length:2061 start_codon:yes stop_codon:yes gene_type:complete